MKVLDYPEFQVTDEMLANKSKRFANYIIDRILFNSIFLVFGFIASLLSELLANEQIILFLDGLDKINPILDFLITTITFTAFYTILESLSQKTIGKLVTNTKVVLENGEKPPLHVIIIRSLCRLIPFDAFSFLGDIPKGWHDTMSKTFVVDVKIFEEQKYAYESYQLIGKEY